jgi:hypothetical protein
VLEGVVGIKYVKLFLCLDSYKIPNNRISRCFIRNFISTNMVRDIREEFRKEGNLE